VAIIQLLSLLAIRILFGGWDKALGLYFYLYWLCIAGGYELKKTPLIHNIRLPPTNGLYAGLTITWAMAWIFSVVGLIGQDADSRFVYPPILGTFGTILSFWIWYRRAAPLAVDEVITVLEQARQTAVDEANTAKASSRKSDIEALWVWLGRVGVGWNLHRALEDFVVALREVVPEGHSRPAKTEPDERETGADGDSREPADGQRRRTSTLRSTLASFQTGIDKIADAADAISIAAGAVIGLAERIDILARRNETYNLISAALNRYIIGNLAIKVLLWSIPTIILTGEFLGLEKHNQRLEEELRLLEKQINTQEEMSVEERDLDYVKLLTCSQGRDRECAGPEVRRRAYLLFAKDQRISSGESMIAFHDVVLNDIKFGGTEPFPRGGWPGISGGYFRSGSFERMDLRLSGISDAVFSGSPFTSTDFRLSLLKKVHFGQSSFRDAIFRGACLIDVDLSSAVGLLPMQLAQANISKRTKLPDNDEGFARLERTEDRELGYICDYDIRWKTFYDIFPSQVEVK
jgi:hypothetical protein